MTFEEWFENEFPEEMSTPTLKLLYKEIAKKGWDAGRSALINASPNNIDLGSDATARDKSIEEFIKNREKRRITFFNNADSTLFGINPTSYIPDN